MDRDIRGIVFKGNAEGLIIVIPEEYSFEQVKKEVGEKLNKATRFFSGATIKVLYRGISLNQQEELELKDILDEKSGAIIESLSKDQEPDNGALATKSTKKIPVSTRKSFFSNEDEDTCKFVRSTVRSGTRITFDGSVVVVGDVNPGGEIVATGNVIVLGALRGMVHAGAEGKRDAFIYSLKLRPTQIRIAEAIARMPDEEEEEGICPEIARVIDGVIIVE
ncbi:MAG: septum site-determining protein MinC [Firmicutes bacterium]|nr:septum site-determining protein MinC [Clostridiaceae bacterium]NMB01277.1 septum site-determining protein MinC [Bacillota bacterium]